MSQDYKANIEELKRLTTKQNADFSKVMDYFMTHFAESDKVLNDSRPLLKNQDFYLAILSPFKEMYDPPVQIAALRLMALPNTDLVHGAGDLSNGKMFILYFFEDLQVGMAAFAMGGDRTDFYRLNTFKGE